MNTKQVALPETCRRSLLKAGILTCVILVLSALVLDCGDTFRVNCSALLVFWSWVAIALYRRPDKLTVGGLWIMRRGLLPFVVCFFIAVWLVWHWRGLL